jgi:hypothetical protein
MHQRFMVEDLTLDVDIDLQHVTGISVGMVASAA